MNLETRRFKVMRCSLSANLWTQDMLKIRGLVVINVIANWVANRMCHLPICLFPHRLCRRPQLPVPGAHSPFFAILATLDDQHHFLQHPSQTVDIGGSNSPFVVIPGKQWPAVLTSIDLVWKPSIAADTHHTGCSQHHSHAG